MCVCFLFVHCDSCSFMITTHARYQPACTRRRDCVGHGRRHPRDWGRVGVVRGAGARVFRVCAGRVCKIVS